MKPKRKAATNWRKIYEACAIDRDYYKAASLKYAENNAELQDQIAVGDALLDKQRERLIRLTEIKNRAQDLVSRVYLARRDKTVTFELGGTAWVKWFGLMDVVSAAETVALRIAALEVDTAVPQKGARP